MVFVKQSTGLGEPNPLDNWHEIYGRTFTAGGFFGVSSLPSSQQPTMTVFQTQRIYSKDIKAIQHIMRNDQLYLKPPVMRNILKSILGEGECVVSSPLPVVLNNATLPYRH